MSRKGVTFNDKVIQNDVFLNRTRARLKRTSQKLRRSMITTADWPPPRVIFNSEMSAHQEDQEQSTTPWFLPCCFQRCRSRSPEPDGVKNTHISQMLMATYKRGSAAKNKDLMLRTGPDGSLICADHVDVNMLVEGFREFERRFQYGTLMPFANVLPSVSPILEEMDQEEVPEEMADNAASESTEEGGRGSHYQQQQVVVEATCKE